MSIGPAQPPETASLDRAAWFATIAGLCGSLVAIGLARFAYTPLIPPLIEARWFSPTDTVTLGAANFVGYLAGALLGRPIAAILTNKLALRVLMVVATAAFFACAYPLTITWFFAWRLLSGLSGGAIMVLVATTILPHIPVARRGFVSGVIFLGIGLGIAASGTLVPALLRIGLRETWIGLGIISLVLTALSWFGWPASPPPETESQPSTVHWSQHQSRALWLLNGQYAANALGLVPGMLLLVDYVARGLGKGPDIGAVYWVIYGLAAIAGPVICGYVGDKIGFGRAYRYGLLLQALAGGFLFAGNTVGLVIATVIYGAFPPGVVALALGRIHEIIPHAHAAQRAAWSRATTAFALFQALGGYGYSFLFSHTDESYMAVFLYGSIALLAAFLTDLIVNRNPRST